jgi:hypothetical protein
MTDRPPGDSGDGGEGGEGGFDWGSPRWREDDSDHAADERGRRASVKPSPHQRGAIDQGGSVSGRHPVAEPQDVAIGDEGEPPTG